MYDGNNILETIKKAAVDAVDASYPCDFCFGKIVSLSPVKIVIDQKLSLGAAQLIMTKTACDNCRAGDKVVIIRKKGGQKFLVIDKVV